MLSSPPIGHLLSVTVEFVADHLSLRSQLSHTTVHSIGALHQAFPKHSSKSVPVQNEAHASAFSCGIALGRNFFCS
jgi:hypothetical protein